jgi:hypothetical protein
MNPTNSAAERRKNKPTERPVPQVAVLRDLCGGRIEEYREESDRSSIFRVRHQVDEKVINKECGHLLTAVGS